jgi:hypothetical protein
LLKVAFSVQGEILRNCLSTVAEATFCRLITPPYRAPCEAGIGSVIASLVPSLSLHVFFFFLNNFAVLAYSFPGEEGCKSLAPIFDRNAK